jgi:NAD(P)-dependent dehydrogenase (short-subunit alcohol dehydrogenase family)
MKPGTSQPPSMEGRVCMVTGANSGIGKATALELAKMGAAVVMVARNSQKGQEALAEIRKETGNNSLDLLIANLSSLESVTQLATQFKAKYPKLHVLVNNAGLFNQKRSVTADGYESTFEINYLAPYLLTNLLLDRLEASAPSRIVNVSSVGHYGGHIDFEDINLEKQYSGWKAYRQ